MGRKYMSEEAFHSFTPDRIYRCQHIFLRAEVFVSNLARAFSKTIAHALSRRKSRSSTLHSRFLEMNTTNKSNHRSSCLSHRPRR
jgi:hypothetical protein